MNKPLLKRPRELEDMHEFLMSSQNLKSVCIQFDDGMSHYATLWQAIEGLSKKRFAPKKEIAEEWLTLLKYELE